MNHDIDRIASRQNSLITTTQMAAAGITANQMVRHHRRGAIELVRRGVYRLAGAPPTWTQAVHAAVLAAGPGAFASHASAARLWGLRHADYTGDAIHLTSRHPRRLAGVTSHTAAVTAGDVTVCHQVPVTTAQRTLLDITATLTGRQLGECLDDALRRQLVHLEPLRRHVDSAAARGGRRLLRPLRQLLEQRPAGYQPGANNWERDMDRLWDTLGLPPGVRQHRVRLNGRTYIIDRALPELKIGAEYHGHEFHHQRSDRDHDAQRQAQLTAAGWHILTITAGTRPQTLRDAIQRLITDRQSWLTTTHP